MHFMYLIDLAKQNVEEMQQLDKDIGLQRLVNQKGIEEAKSLEKVLNIKNNKKFE